MISHNSRRFFRFLLYHQPLFLAAQHRSTTCAGDLGSRSIIGIRWDKCGRLWRVRILADEDAKKPFPTQTSRESLPGNDQTYPTKPEDRKIIFSKMTAGSGYVIFPWRVVAYGNGFGGEHLHFFPGEIRDGEEVSVAKTRCFKSNPFLIFPSGGYGP